jgi:hypothetical protein
MRHGRGVSDLDLLYFVSELEGEDNICFDDVSPPPPPRSANEKYPGRMDLDNEHNETEGELSVSYLC